MEIEINNEILIWAIERAGISIEEISKHFPKFISWLEGKKKPTLNQLEKFAKKVHLPFGYLFLETPPIEKLPIPFFRTIQPTEVQKVSINVYDAILIVQKRQEWLTEYLIDNDYAPLSFVGKFKNSNNILEIVEDIRRTLGLKRDWAKEFPNWEKAKEHLTQSIENVGIIITFSSIVGNNPHRNIKVEECRGFVLVNEYAPFMFINSADSKSAQIFTIAHELAHIWIGASAGFDFRQLQPANNSTEILCDQIAAELLVPAQDLQSAILLNKSIKELARQFKVSQIVIARRLLDIGKINRTEFFNFYNDYINCDFEKSTESGGGNFYNLQKKRLSIRFLNFVNQAVRENKLLLRDAYQLTGMKGNTFHTFMKEHLF